MERLAASELQKQALWLFGVLLGVAIKEAITNFYDGLEGQNGLWCELPKGARILLFLVVSVRFYLAAIQYFNASYGAAASTVDLRRRRFGTDLGFGLIQFAIVCFWGLSITEIDRHWPRFPALLLGILLCDVLWYAWAIRETRKTIRIRVLVNAFTAASATIAFGTTALGFMCFANGWRVELTQAQGAICEAAAYVPVVIASAVELGRLVHGRAGVEEWLGEALPRPEAHAR